MTARPLYPFLFAVYLALAFAAENRELIIRPVELLGTVALSLGVAISGWLLSRLVTLRSDRRALLTLAFVLAFSLFERFRLELNVWTPGALHGALAGFVVWLALLAACAFLVRLGRRSLAPLTAFLNLTSAIVLLFPLLSLIGASRAQAASAAGEAPAETVLDLPVPPAVPLPANAPDIYLIVLDQYTGSAALREVYGYDNSPFERALESRGFVVPARAHGNYAHTILSLASMLNWTHLEGLATALGRDSHRLEPVYQLIESNRAVHFLRASGYRFVFLPTSFPATASNRWADHALPAPPRAGARLVDAWLRATPIGAARDWNCRRTQCLRTDFPYEIESAAHNEWKLDRLGELAAGEPGPKFVLAHLVLPHEPYLFEADCSRRAPFWPLGPESGDGPAFRAAYTDQITCLNRMLLDVVEEILETSEREPVILLQSDHGHGRIPRDRLGRNLIPFEAMDTAQVRERLSTFAAYYLPPVDGGEAVSADVTPVNLLPLVFDRYLGTSFGRAPDHVYWSEYGRLYDFRRVDPDAYGLR